MSTSDADLAFLSLALEEENAQRRPLPIDTLIALSAFRRQRRLKRSELAHFISKGEDGAGRVLEALVERGCGEMAISMRCSDKNRNTLV